ncbi:helix-turn-helix domain-containing protein [Marinobacterium sp. YM272]|uniref:helix-turn-helix domain-containing protein n=1 Tax=Marinobacterium sp. YM272 TaxID=3421654 RepID=UPI003D7FC0B0
MPQNILTVQLYGDEVWQQTSDYLHCEPLITRSREHQFKIRPHRHPGITQVFHLRRGHGQAKIDGQKLEVKAPSLILISPMSVHDFAWSDDVSGTVLSIATARLERARRSEDAPLPLSSTSLVRLAGQDRELDQLFEMLLKEYRRAPDAARDGALQAYVNLLSLRVERLEHERLHDSERQHRGQQHLKRFLDEVNRDYVQQRSVESYAEELSITAPYLNQLCRELTGRHALQIIHERLIIEARRNLIYTALRVSEIAYQLGFSDPAYFTRFFRRQTGCSPREYRRMNTQEEITSNKNSAATGRPSR